MHCILQGLLAANDGYNRNVAEQAAPLRAAWAVWNPQRAAGHELASAVARGDVTAEECADLRSAHFAAQKEVLRGSQKAAEMGGLAHPSPFRWPAPKSVEVCASINVMRQNCARSRIAIPVDFLLRSPCGSHMSVWPTLAAPCNHSMHTWYMNAGVCRPA